MVVAVSLGVVAGNGKPDVTVDEKSRTVVTPPMSTCWFRRKSSEDAAPVRTHRDQISTLAINGTIAARDRSGCHRPSRKSVSVVHLDGHRGVRLGIHHTVDSRTLSNGGEILGRCPGCRTTELLMDWTIEMCQNLDTINEELMAVPPT